MDEGDLKKIEGPLKQALISAEQNKGKECFDSLNNALTHINAMIEKTEKEVKEEEKVETIEKEEELTKEELEKIEKDAGKKIDEAIRLLDEKNKLINENTLLIDSIVKLRGWFRKIISIYKESIFKVKYKGKILIPPDSKGRKINYKLISDFFEKLKWARDKENPIKELKAWEYTDVEPFLTSPEGLFKKFGGDKGIDILNDLKKLNSNIHKINEINEKLIANIEEYKIFSHKEEEQAKKIGQLEALFEKLKTEKTIELDEEKIRSDEELSKELKYSEYYVYSHLKILSNVIEIEKRLFLGHEGKTGINKYINEFNILVDHLIKDLKNLKNKTSINQLLKITKEKIDNLTELSNKIYVYCKTIEGYNKNEENIKKELFKDEKRKQYLIELLKKNPKLKEKIKAT